MNGADHGTRASADRLVSRGRAAPGRCRQPGPDDDVPRRSGRALWTVGPTGALWTGRARPVVRSRARRPRLGGRVSAAASRRPRLGDRVSATASVDRVPATASRRPRPGTASRGRCAPLPAPNVTLGDQPAGALEPTPDMRRPPLGGSGGRLCRSGSGGRSRTDGTAMKPARQVCTPATVEATVAGPGTLRRTRSAGRSTQNTSR